MPRLVSLGSVVAVVTLVTGCSLAAGQSPGQLLNDVTMTATVKKRLAATEGVGSLTDIHVRTHDDMVYLTGRVPDQAARARIDALVRNIAGHNRVSNELTVESEKRGTNEKSEARTR